MTVRPSDSRNSIWIKSDAGGVWSFGSVRKTKISELSDVLRVDRRAARSVSPGAHRGMEESAVIVNGKNDCSSRCVTLLVKNEERYETHARQMAEGRVAATISTI